MNPRILVTGNGKSGSWKIRGEQLGNAMDATVAPHGFSGTAHVMVFVKRVDPRVLEAARRMLSPPKIVWDIVDAWPQPHGNLWGRPACINWLRWQLEVIKPHAVVAATECMAADIRECFAGPVLALPHHARPGLRRHTVSRAIRTVGYEGGVQYLGRWHDTLAAECRQRGWVFALNPSDYSALDIVVAFREADGYAAKNWKSNVKLANAQGAGIPFVGQRTAGYYETKSGGEEWVDDPKRLPRAFDRLDNARTRELMAAEMFNAAPRLSVIAATYRAWLETL